MKYVLPSLLCILLAGCTQKDKPANMKAPISNFKPIDISIPEGMQYSQNCNIEGYVKNIGFAECLLYPISEEQRLEGVDLEQKKFGLPIGRQIGNLGYKLGKREGIHLWFEKPFDKDCNERLVVLFWYDADLDSAINAVKTSELAGIENNSIVFVQAKNLACNEQRLYIP